MPTSSPKYDGCTVLLDLKWFLKFFTSTEKHTNGIGTETLGGLAKVRRTNTEIKLW